jgi:hypothetical protein
MQRSPGFASAAQVADVHVRERFHPRFVDEIGKRGGLSMGTRHCHAGRSEAREPSDHLQT